MLLREIFEASGRSSASTELVPSPEPNESVSCDNPHFQSLPLPFQKILPCPSHTLQDVVKIIKLAQSKGMKDVSDPLIAYMTAMWPYANPRVNK